MKKARILVVDDDQDVLDMAHSFFRNAGLEFHCAEGGEKALDKIREISFSVIITDYNMPGMNGLELYEKIRNIAPTTPVILVTGQPSQELTQLATQAGIKSVLAKPLQLEKLLTMVNEMTEITFS